MGNLTIDSCRNREEKLTFWWPDHPPDLVGILCGKVVVYVENPATPRITEEQVKWMASATHEEARAQVHRCRQAPQDLKLVYAKIDVLDGKQHLHPGLVVVETRKKLKKARKNLELTISTKEWADTRFSNLSRLVGWLKAAPLEIRLCTHDAELSAQVAPSAPAEEPPDPIPPPVPPRRQSLGVPAATIPSAPLHTDLPPPSYAEVMGYPSMDAYYEANQIN